MRDSWTSCQCNRLPIDLHTDITNNVHVYTTADLPYRPSSHAVTGSRVPQTQILIQMASMLTEQIQATAEGKILIINHSAYCV